MPALKYISSTFISLFLLVLCLSYAQAQHTLNPYQAKIDSLQILIKYQPKADTNTVKRLNYLARICFYDMQFQRGLLAALEARQLAKKLHYAKGDALYWRTLAIFDAAPLGYYYYNYLAKWSYADQKQQEEIPQLGVDYPTKPNLEKVKTELQVALNYFEKHPDPNREILANLLVIYVGFNKREDQAPYIDKIYRQLRENNLTTALFFLRVYDMVYLEREGKLKESKEAEIEARTILANTKNNREVALMNYYLSLMYLNQNRTSSSFELIHQVDQLLEQIGEKELRIDVLSRLADACFNLSLNKKAIEYFKKVAALCEKNVNQNAYRLILTYHQIAFSYIRLKEFDQAKTYIAKAKNVPPDRQSENNKKFNTARHYDAMGQLLMGQGNYQEALKNFAQARTYADQTFQSYWLPYYMTYYSAQCYQKLGQLQESIKYGKVSYDTALANYANSSNLKTILTKSSLLLSEVYEEAGQPLEAHKYLKMYQKLRKETDEKEETNHLLDAEIRSVVEKDEQEKLLQNQRILAIEKQREIDGLKAQAEKQLLQSKAEQAELDKKLEKQQLEAKALENKRQQDYQISLLNLDIDTQRKVRTALLGGLALFALFAVVLFRQNRTKQRFNQTLTKQKAEIESQRDRLNQTLGDLRSTQAQLVQKEKLASLGELTAGIAHEIQNPLNFVNNFSEVSTELVDELKEGPFQQLPDAEKEYAEEILSDLTQNLQKITHHGGRASSIIKGMLEHSRTGTGERQSTDINALADEYLRLAYQGRRAKDKNFNCELVTEFDGALGRAEVVPQEIGRVLLNLYNNAFYAVSERAELTADTNYKPTVKVTTQRRAGKIDIRVSDNGIGIPESVKAKIFQPFFTTKPTGEGTGLGLSLSYDIITKGHGGTMEAESTEGEGTELIVTLPIE